MNSRKLVALSLVAFLIIVAALWIGYSRTPRDTAEARLYPELKGRLADVQSVSIFKAGDLLVVELARDKGAWKVKQRSNFAADSGKVGNLLIALADATLREQKTANAANYAALGVQDVSDQAATGMRVELSGIDPPVKLIVGKRDQATRSTYVRRAGEQQSWQIGGEIELPTEVGQWLKRDLVNIGADRIQEVSVQMTGSSPYSSVKKSRADANFDVTGLPRGRELNSVAAANAVAQSLSSLQIDDVLPAKDLAANKSNGHVVFHTFDGLVVDVTGYALGDQRWVTVHAGFDQDAAKKFHLPTETAKEPAPADQPAKDAAAKDKAAQAPTENKAAAPDTSLETLIKKGKEEADAINASTDSWAFALPPFKYDAIFKPVDDLLKKPELLKKK